jgi:hypothetical protein
VKAAVIALALLAASTAGADVAPRVTATASRTEVGVGETFTVDVAASGPAGTGWTFPAEAGNESVELRTPSPAPGASPPALPPGTHRYEAAAFALGEVEVPAVTVKYRLPDGTTGEAASAPVKLNIVSVLPKEQGQPQLADIRPPLALSIGLPFWIALGLAVLLLGGLLAGLLAWLLRRQRPAAAPVVPAATAEEQARQALDALAASDLLGRGELRAFYIALIEIAKRYLERRLQAPILEMTSSETVAFLRAHQELHDLAFATRDLTNAADQVKFARGLAALDEAQRHLAMVRQLVETVEVRLRPAPARGTEAPAA